jgi:hypothetical protein
MTPRQFYSLDEMEQVEFAFIHELKKFAKSINPLMQQQNEM